MKSRDFRAPVLRKMSSGEFGLFEKILFSTYAFVSHRRIKSFSRHKERLNAKIISIGNITFGGVGKTPVVSYLARYFTEKGIDIGIALPGYKSKSRNSGILVSDNMDKIGVIEKIGDEATSLADEFKQYNVKVYIDKNRINAAKELIRLFNCQIIIMDDAFHFTSIFKDADICLINALNPFGAGPNHLAGLLREPPHAINRADAVIINHRALFGEEKYIALEKNIRYIGFQNPVFSADYLPHHIESSDGSLLNLDDASKLKLLPVSGIGCPEAFEASLRSLGICFNNPFRFNDHHIFSKKDICLIKNAIKQDNADGIITTPKDFARLNTLSDILDFHIYILHSTIRLDADFLSWLEHKLNLSIE